MFFSNKYRKAGVSLLELAIYVCVMAILLSTVLVSRSLIAAARSVKIWEHYRGFVEDIAIFQLEYKCLPGDCAAAQVLELLPYLPGYNTTGYTGSSYCTTPTTPVVALSDTNKTTYMALNTGMIESTAKRTCMMYELQAAGHLMNNELNSSAFTAVTVLGTNNSVGVAIPAVLSYRQAAWDYRIIATTAVSGFQTLPVSLSNMASNATIANNPYNGYGISQLVLRDSVSSQDIISGAGNAVKYGITASLSQKLDTKFDDGLPYSGVVIAGKQFSMIADTASVDCTNTTTAENTFGAGGTGFLSSQYLTTNNITNGCLLSFVINNQSLT